MRKYRPTTCKKGNSNAYNAQVASAATANAAIAQRAQDFTEDYYAKYVAPLMEQMTAASKTTLDREGQLFDSNMESMATAKERYNKYGIPAEDAYFKMVKDYSAPEEEARQAEGALGDVRVAAQNQQNQTRRQMSALGVSANSPAAIAAASDQAIANTAASAAAANRARAAAKSLGMSLTSDAANFGRGGQSSILQFGQAASGNNTGAFGVANSAVQGSAAGASVPMSGYNTALQGYGANLNAYSGLQKAQMDQNAQSAGGFGQLVGTLGSAAIKAGMFGSDRRLKKNIKWIAYLANGLDLYSFEYIDPANGEGSFLGYMADDVAVMYPDAVSTRPDGYAQVDYDKVPS